MGWGNYIYKNIILNNNLHKFHFIQGTNLKSHNLKNQEACEAITVTEAITEAITSERRAYHEEVYYYELSISELLSRKLR